MSNAYTTDRDWRTRAEDPPPFGLEKEIMTLYTSLCDLPLPEETVGYWQYHDDDFSILRWVSKHTGRKTCDCFPFDFDRPTSEYVYALLLTAAQLRALGLKDYLFAPGDHESLILKNFHDNFPQT